MTVALHAKLENGAQSLELTMSVIVWSAVLGPGVVRLLLSEGRNAFNAFQANGVALWEPQEITLVWIVLPAHGVIKLALSQMTFAFNVKQE